MRLFSFYVFACCVIVSSIVSHIFMVVIMLIIVQVRVSLICLVCLVVLSCYACRDLFLWFAVAAHIPLVVFRYCFFANITAAGGG